MKTLSFRLWAVVLLVALGLFFIAPVQSQATPTQTIESDDPRVLQNGNWASQNAAAASNSRYLFSSGAESDILGLSFVGSAIEIIYVSGPQFGTLAIEIDGTVVRTVITTAEKIEYGLSAKVDYLSDEPHTVKAYAQAGGIVAVDAFRITPVIPIVGDGPVPSQAIDDGGIQSSTCAPFNAIHRVSVSSTGVQGLGDSASPSFSANGRYVAFSSEATDLIAGDGDTSDDVFVYDRTTCILQLISVSTRGTKGNDDSTGAFLSADGRYVAFSSHATNLVSADTNGFLDTFIHDRQLGTTTRISVTTGGAQATGGLTFASDITPDGRYIVFESEATNLVAGDTNAARDVFVRDRQTNTTTRVSVATGGTQAALGDSSSGVISDDGRYVAFSSEDATLVAADTNVSDDIFVHDRQTNTTTRVSVATGGTQANGHSFSPVLSADARYVVITSHATNLVAGDTNAQPDVFVHDRQTTTTTRVSVATGGTQATGGVSVSESASPDVRYIVITSAATNLVAGDTNGELDVFVHDRQTTTTTRVNLAADGTQAAAGFSSDSIISADGRYIAFTSNAGNLVPHDTNGDADIFVTPRILTSPETLALFSPTFEHVDLLDTLADNPAAERYTAFSAYAPPTTPGLWVMGDWNGDGLETPGVYYNGPFYYTNKLGESQPSDWRSLWIGIAGPPVAGHFDAALDQDCIGAVQQATLSGFTVFVLYYTCDFSGNTAPAISSQWLSSVLPDSLGLTGVRQFSAGDYDGDGAETIAVRRDGYIAYTNVEVTLPAEFGFAQFIGAPAITDYGIFVVGDWDADGVASFGLFYQSGELFYRNDLQFNSGVYVNQSVGTPFAGTVQATTWR